MDIKIQAIHFEATEKLQDFIQKKVSKLARFDSEIGKVEVSLKVVKPESALNKEVDMRVYVKGRTLFASETCDTFRTERRTSGVLRCRKTHWDHQHAHVP